MIKKYILGLGIGLLSFIGFSNAYQFLYVGLNGSASNDNSNYTVGVLPKARFISTYLGSSKAVLAFNSQRMFWWLPNDGGLYMYWNTELNSLGVLQGVFQYVSACDEISLDSTGALNNCDTPYTYDPTDTFISNFLSSIDNNDYAFINVQINNFSCGGYCTYYRFDANVCFSSKKYHSTLCFVGNKSSTYMSPYVAPNPFTGSLDFQDLNFAKLSWSNIGEPPGFVNNINGSSNNADNVGLTGNLLYNRCINGYVLTKLDRIMPNFRYLCQGGFSDTGIILDQSSMINLNPIPGQGADFKTIFALTKNGMSWSDWYNTNSTTYRNWILNQSVYSQNPFYGKNALLYSYFKIINDYGYGDPLYAYDVLNACKLLLYSDWNAEYNGSYFSWACDDLASSDHPVSVEYSTGENGSVDDDNEVTPPGRGGGGGGGGGLGGGGGGGGNTNSSGTIVSVDWSGTLSGEDNKNFDGTTFINDFYQKLQANFQKPIGSLFGIVPNFIVVFLLALILFRFLSH